MSKLIKFKQGIYQNPTHFDVTDVSGNTKKIVPNFGTVIQQGTLFTSEIFNEITRQISYTVIDTNTVANTYIGTLEGLESGDLTDNLKIILVPNTNNTGPSTINIQSLGVISIKKQGNIALEKGDIIRKQHSILNYSSEFNCFELLNPMSYNQKLEDLFTSVSNGKSLIATAITDKGVPTNSSDTFQKMADNINEIKIKYYSVGSTSNYNTFELMQRFNFDPVITLRMN